MIPSFKIPRVGGGAGFFAMTNPICTRELETIHLEVTKEALRQTELRLEDLEKNATSAERRLGVFVSVCAVLASITFLYSTRLPYFEVALLSGILLIFVATLAVWIALPRKFHSRGHFWRDWKGHLEDKDKLHVVLASQAEENDARIDTNEAELDRLAVKFRLCFNLFFWSVCLSIGGQLGGALFF